MGGYCPCCTYLYLAISIANSAVRLPERRVRSSTGLTPVRTRRGGNPGFAAESLKPHFPRRCAAEPGGAHTGGLRPHKACTPIGNKRSAVLPEKHARCRKTICPPATGLHCNLSPCDQVTRGCPAHQAWAPATQIIIKIKLSQFLFNNLNACGRPGVLRVALGLRRLTHTLPPQPHIDAALRSSRLTSSRRLLAPRAPNCARLFGVSSMQAAGCGSAAISSTSSLHAVFFTCRVGFQHTTHTRRSTCTPP